MLAIHMYGCFTHGFTSVVFWMIDVMDVNRETRSATSSINILQGGVS